MGGWVARHMEVSFVISQVFGSARKEGNERARPSLTPKWRERRRWVWARRAQHVFGVCPQAHGVRAIPPLDRTSLFSSGLLLQGALAPREPLA